MEYKGSIRKRLIIIIMSVTFLTGIIGYSSFVYWYMNNQYDRALNLAKTVSLVLGQDFAKLVLLNEVSAAADITSSLKSFSNLNRMVLYKLDGNPILEYSIENKSFEAEELPTKQNRDITISGNNLKLYTNANYQDTHLGYIQYSFKIDTIYDVIKKNLNALLLIFLSVFSIAYFLATYAAKRFTEPILALVQFLEKVYTTDSFDKKINTKEDNEFGKLYEEVNTMLERIEESRKELKLAAVSFETQSGMIITDKNKRILRVNNAFTNITGYSTKDAIGKTPNILKSGIHKSSFYKKLHNSLKENNYWVGEITNKHKGGKLVNELLSIYSVLDEDGKVIYYVSSYIDITAQKEAEAKLKENEALLVQQSKMAAMGEMIENIAHQWRQPISLISAISTGLLLKREFNNPIDINEEKESLNRINETTQYMSDTIEDFREFFKHNKKRKSFNLKGSYLRSLKLINSSFNKMDIEIIEELEDVNINSFENELIQVIINILNNAKDALEDKKIDNKLVIIKIYKDSQNGYISIKDNAGGIPETIIEKVFDSYFTTKESKNGTGIGLHMSKEMVVSHMQGSIEVHNETFNYEDSKYKGANFIISLPL